MKTNARIYVMRAEDGTLKLGHSIDPERRRKEMKRAVEIVHTTDVVEHVERIERLAHRVLALHGRHIKGEWFEATLESAITAIEIATKQAEGAELALGAFLGRPDLPEWSADHTEHVMVKASPAQMEKLDDLRRAEADLPSRSEMVRRLIERSSERARGKK